MSLFGKAEVSACTTLAVFLWILPALVRALPRRSRSCCGCVAGLQKCFGQHLWVYGRIVTVLNVALITWAVIDVDAVDVNEYFFKVVGTISAILDQLEMVALGMAALAVIVLLCALKGRILLALGVERGESVFRAKTADVFAWLGWSRYQVVELFIWKVEDLPITATNTFVECHLGYNEAMVTRVHPEGDTSTVFKESMQLNFDPDDEQEYLVLQVKSQGVVGAEQLARIAISRDELREIVEETGWDCPTKHDAELWDRRFFREMHMVPKGRVWIRFALVHDQDEPYMKTVVDRATTRSWWTHWDAWRRYQRDPTATHVPLSTHAQP